MTAQEGDNEKSLVEQGVSRWRKNPDIAELRRWIDECRSSDSELPYSRRKKIDDLIEYTAELQAVVRDWSNESLPNSYALYQRVENLLE